jgi:hypothetical protein
MANKQLSIRITPQSLARLDAESRRMRLSRSEVARTLLEEGLRMEAHPGIVFRDGPAGRRPGLKNGADVWEVMGAFPKRKASEAGIPHVMKVTGLQEGQVRVALRYYLDFREEIDAWIRRNDEAAQEGYAEWLRKQQQQVPS